jgi:hypothetical protein
MFINARVAERLAASQEGLSSMELVNGVFTRPVIPLKLEVQISNIQKSVPILQETDSVSITKTTSLMLFRKIKT